MTLKGFNYDLFNFRVWQSPGCNSSKTGTIKKVNLFYNLRGRGGEIIHGSLNVYKHALAIPVLQVCLAIFALYDIFRIFWKIWILFYLELI